MVQRWEVCALSLTSSDALLKKSCEDYPAVFALLTYRRRGSEDA